MSLEEFVGELSAEATDAVRKLLRQAYDRGYREGLASTGQPEAPPVVAPPPPAPAAPPVPQLPVQWTGGAADEPEVEEVDEGESENDDQAGEAPAPRAILANAMVGTLRRRIIRTFDLGRFDIDVVICRSGDPGRRQLRSTVRLALYRKTKE